MRPLVIVGDALLDRDLDGRAGRLSPDAPVPVVEDLQETVRPGGAGLAALLAAEEQRTGDGREVVLIAPLGAGEAAATLRELLGAHVRVVELELSGDIAQKTRIRAGGHPLVRLDRPDSGTAGAPGARVAEALAEAGAVLVSDYGRGLTAGPRMRDLLARTAHRTPMVWDPHPRGADPVPGVRLLCPNEAEALARCAGGDAADAAAELAERFGATGVAVTLGGRGAVLSLGDRTPLFFPAEPADGADPCGAGDRFAVAAAGLLARGALPSEAVEGAVAAASEFVRSGGVSALGREPAAAPRHDAVARTRRRGGTVVATGGCFDVLHAGHVATLRAARALGDCLVVCLNSDASVRRRKGPGRPVNAEEDRAAVLSALDCVDSVEVFDEDTPERVLSEIRPDIWAKGGDYVARELPEAALLRSWGGRTVVLPYLPGRSTTQILARG